MNDTYKATQLATTAGMRTGNDVGADISRFEWFLRDPENREFVFPPFEIIPVEVLHLPGDEGDVDDVSSEVVELRVRSFVEQLIAKNPRTWGALTFKLVSVPAAHDYLQSFALIFIGGTVEIKTDDDPMEGEVVRSELDDPYKYFGIGQT